jgi:hypothetical protein
VSDGDGRTCQDVAMRSAVTVDVRRERHAASNGRVYSIQFTVASPITGATTAASCQVAVPHDARSAPAVVDTCSYCVGEDCGSCPTSSPTCAPDPARSGGSPAWRLPQAPL